MWFRGMGSIFSICCPGSHTPIYKMKTRVFGKLPFAQPVQIYELENKHGMQLSVISFGARIVGLKVPDLNGQLVDVVRGFASMEDYMKDEYYFGAVVGRVAGRISPSNVMIEGKACNLVPNTQNVHMNGGKNGFDTAIWFAETIEEDDKNGISGVRFRYVSAEGSEGYPGELVTELEYRLTNDNELIIRLKCSTEDDTVISIPVHAYFNLGGEKEKDIYDHVLTVLADEYTPTDAEWIPTGDVVPVEGTPYDFRNGRQLGPAIASAPYNGFDDNWCLGHAFRPLTKPTLSAKLYNPKNGVHMDVLTTQPGMTVYTANFLKDDIKGKYGEPNGCHSSVCLLAQNYPNAVNVPTFPSAVLKKGQTVEHTTIYRFSKHKEKGSVKNTVTETSYSAH